MCGLAGVKRFGDTPITEAEISILLCSLENRGNHATGVALQNDGDATIHVHKKDIPAWSFIADDNYLQFMETFLTPATRTIILHTRAATHGAPYKNENNHPIYLDKTAIVHNGSISNSDALFGKLHAPRSCETDSDIIRAILDRDGFTQNAVRRLSEMTGSAAIAAIRADAPGELLLARSGNPVVYANFNDKLYWASELHAIQKAVRPWVEKYGLFMRESNARIAHHSMPDNTAYLIGPDGVEWKQEFTVCSSFKPVTYRVHDTYFHKRRGWKLQKDSEERRKTIVAPAENRSSAGYCPKCNISVHKLDPTKDWKDYFCHRCKEGLGELDV